MHISVGSSSLGPFLFEGANMAEWQHFKFYQPRPETTAPSDESQRKLLEMAAAVKVSSMLSFFGTVRTTEVNNSDSDIEGTFTYEYIAIEPQPLTDDDEVKIEQLPATSIGCLTGKGIHAIELVDEDDTPWEFYTVYDPAIHCDRPLVVGAEDESITLDVLHELLDALTVIETELGIFKKPNHPPLDVTAYPRPVVEQSFVDIIQNI